MFGKVAISKIFEYSTLGSEFPKKQYQELEKVYEFDKNEGDNVEYNKSYLIYDASIL